MTKLYTRTHEWLESADGSLYSIGISEHAREQLGDLVFLELPTIGDKLVENGKLAVIESIKAASDIYSPIAGIVEEVNSELLENLDNLQNNPETSGWLVKLKVDSPVVTKADGDNSLLKEDEYKSFISGE